jgi:hypothetical protein
MSCLVIVVVLVVEGMFCSAWSVHMCICMVYTNTARPRCISASVVFSLLNASSACTAFSLPVLAVLVLHCVCKDLIQACPLHPLVPQLPVPHLMMRCLGFLINLVVSYIGVVCINRGK